MLLFIMVFFSTLLLVNGDVQCRRVGVTTYCAYCSMAGAAAEAPLGEELSPWAGYRLACAAGLRTVSVMCHSCHAHVPCVPEVLMSLTNTQGMIFLVHLCLSSPVWTRPNPNALLRAFYLFFHFFLICRATLRIQ